MKFSLCDVGTAYGDKHRGKGAGRLGASGHRMGRDDTIEQKRREGSWCLRKEGWGSGNCQNINSAGHGKTIVCSDI